jgi:DnaD/phage-associated family protein
MPTLTKFAGFPEGKVRFTGLPEPFFRELLPLIDDLAELKVILFAIWRLDRMEGAFRYLRRADFTVDRSLMDGLDPDPDAAVGALDAALARCLERGALLEAAVDLDGEVGSLYFLNSARGRAAVEAIQRGDWRPSGEAIRPVELAPEHPNIYRLYEENIGPLTPMIAEQLRDAEGSYPAAWIEEAVSIAVENNVRRWNYVAAILERWQEGGRDERKDRRDTEKDRRRYVEGELSDFIEH